MATSKVVLVNNSAGKTKYGSRHWASILKAVDGLIAADKKRGVETKVFPLDSVSQMKTVGGKAVANTSSAMQTKRAIDAIFDSIQPHYLMILGSPDLIPHVDLRNPIADGNKFVPSDLPYACDQPYALDIEKFKGPTRVLGRLPDILGETDPAYLIGLLKTATHWKSRLSTSYRNYFGLTADVWRGSTRTSVRKLFKTTKKLNLVPPESVPWTKAELGARMHFINCHGADLDHRFFGENENGDFPTAHASDALNGVTEGTVVAAECCFGAQLYQPLPIVPMAICNRYLQLEAYGLVGSTNIAYGPAEGNGLADLVCIYFLQNVQHGASIGRAMLEARQKFINEEEPVGPHALKTLAQFNLLGDPSIHPVKKSKTKKKTSRAMATDVAAKASSFLPESVAVATSSRIMQSIVDRSQRRQDLFDRGQQMAQTTMAADTGSRTGVSGDLRKQMLDIVKNQNLGQVASMESFKVDSVSKKDASRTTVASKSLLAAEKSVTQSRFLIAPVSDEPTSKKGKYPLARVVHKDAEENPVEIVKTQLLVAREQDGKIQSFKKYVAR